MSNKQKQNGTTTAYLRFAHNKWDPKAKYAKARVSYSFVREGKVDRAILERLVKSISRFLFPEQVWEAREAIGEASDFLFQSCKRLDGVWLWINWDSIRFSRSYLLPVTIISP